MNDNKKDLKTLIDFVTEISKKEGNEWFKKDLFESLNINNTLYSELKNGFIESKISLIEKYLSVDIVNVIDYSEFEEPSREQLFRDCLEMCRFEKGTPNHKKDFGEFCRYAHLQAEEMINYFFNKSLNFDLIKMMIFMKNHSNYIEKIKAKNLNQIPYSLKLPAFRNYSKIEKPLIDFLFFLNNFRNEMSHRNSLSAGEEDQQLKLYEAKGFTKGQIDFSKLDQNDQTILNNGLYVIRKRKQDFKEVFFALEQFKKNILYHTKNYKDAGDSSNNIGSLNPSLKLLKDKLDK
jgi:hypothetical protein